MTPNRAELYDVPQAARRNDAASNCALERTAGSHALAAAAYHERSPHERAVSGLLADAMPSESEEA